MRRYLALALIAALVLPAFAAVTPAQAQGINILVDMSHGQNPGGLIELMKIVPEAHWIVLLRSEDEVGLLPDWVVENAELRFGGFTGETLDRVDMVIIGQPTQLPDITEVNALVAWFGETPRALWVAADSDYPAQGSELAQEFANIVLEAIGSKLRMDYVSVEDDESNAGRTYRVVGIIDPPPELAELGYGAEKILFHGPGAVAAVLPDGTWVNPLATPVEGVYVIVRTTDAGRIVEHQPAEPGAPGNLGIAYTVGETGRFPLLAVEIMENGNKVIVSSESPYSGYRGGVTPIYYGVVMQGMRFIRNLILWATGYGGELLAYKEILQELKKIDEVLAAVDEVSAALDSLSAQVSGQLGELSSKIDEVSGKLSDLESRVGSVEGAVSGLSDTVSGLEGRISSLESEVGGVKGSISGLEGRISGLEGKISDLEGKLAGLESRIAGVEGAVGTPMYVAVLAVILAIVAIALGFVKKK